MVNSYSSLRRLLSRQFLLLLILTGLLCSTACGLFGTRKQVQVPPMLTPLVDANRAQLIAEVNRLASIKSIRGKVDIQFEDTSFADVGIAEKYRQADGTITLQRPGKVYLIIQVPFIATDIAQMTSDGENFRVAVLQGDEKYRRFVKGTNSATYEKLELNGKEAESAKGKKKTMTGKETVSALSNLRPQHLTDAFMINPVGVQAGLVYSQSEFFQEEPDIRPRAKKGSRVVRGYYLLEEFSAASGDEMRLLRRFWFDRVGGIRLGRLQTYDERGMLVTDISYWDDKPVGSEGRKLPSRIDITRPHDHYRLSLTYQAPASMDIDREYRPEAFVLENRWQLPEVDLDAPQSKRAKVSN
ncbi:MAG TPA: hypothetical protein VFH01_07725 [Pyrinomonadaceae bacterium]|nr:hypothetical protein [Pyrinomonadaceae bacterium]